MSCNRTPQRAASVLTGIAALLLASSPGSAGTLKGKISTSKKGKPAKINVTTDTAVCGKSALYDPTMIVAADGGLANAVVSIEKVKKGKKPTTTTVTISQSKCEYTPHVAAAAVGSKVMIVNGDKTLHNVHTYLDGDTMFNMAMPNKGQKATKDLEEAGIVDFKCDVHNWMSAHIHVFDHAYFAVTGADGSFSIGDVPAGSYKVTIWHEKLGTKSQRVKIADGDTQLDFSF